MKESMRKLKKGLLALFVLNLIVITLSITVQSCQNDDTLFDNSSSNLETKLNNSFEDFNNFKSNLSHSKNSNDSINEIRAIELLTPVVNETKILLEQKYGINENELKEIFNGNENDPRIAIVGLAILTKEKAGEIRIAQHQLSLFTTSAYAFPTGNQAVDCALEALGFSSFDIIRDFMSGSLGRTAVRRLLIGMAGRVMGPIGIAIVVAEWGWCMSN